MTYHDLPRPASAPLGRAKPISPLLLHRIIDHRPAAAHAQPANDTGIDEAMGGKLGLAICVIVAAAIGAMLAIGGPF